jgi:SNF2 family DNA or RNA helicase
MPDNKSNIQKLVFAVAETDNLGALIKPFVVELAANQQFTYNFRNVNHNTISDYPLNPAKAELELLKLLDDYTEDVIVRKFSKEKKKLTDFFSQLPEEQFKRLVRPYIEKILSKSIAIIIEAGIPLYFKGKRTHPIPDQALQTIKTPAEVVFNFIRNTEETHYFQTIRLNETELTLTNKNAILLCELPCWLILENKLLTFSDNVDGAKLIPFFSKTHIVIPKQTEKKYFQSFVLNTIKNFSVNADGFDIIEEKPAIKTILSLEKNFLDEPVFIMKFRYGNNPDVLHNSEKVYVRLQEEKESFIFFVTRRDLDFEEKRKELLREIGLNNSGDSTFALVENQVKSKAPFTKLIIWLNKNAQFLKTNNFEIEQCNIAEKYHTGSAEKTINISKNNDWFDIEINIRFGEFIIPFHNLKHHILNNISEYLLPNGEIALIPEEWFSKMKNMIMFGSDNEKGISLKKHYYGMLDVLTEEVQLEKLPELKALLKKDKFKLPEIDKNLLAILRTYQKKGIAWLTFLQRNNWGGILADDMGLGKTIQAIALLQSIRTTDPVKVSELPMNEKNPQLELFGSIHENTVITPALMPSLIIMPLSLIHNWENEIDKFSPGMKIYKHIGINRTDNPSLFSRYDIILTTYGTLRNDIEMINDFKFHYLILDESQQIKNPFSKNYAAVKQLNALHKIILSGTPIENSLNDLWSQFSIINPGLLGSFSFFKNEFTIPIEKNKNTESQERLKSIINPFILRRTKDEVAKELPPLTEKYHYCEMTDAQQNIYEIKKSELRNFMFEKIEKTGIARSKFIILSGLMKLRLMASHPVLASKDYLYDSGKFLEVLRNLEKLKLENHKVLIFSQFVKHLKLFKNYFDSVFYPYSFLTGDTDYKSRIAAIDNFHSNPNNQFFLISFKAGGLGLNLTAADYVFVLDPWWNPSVEMQAINRAHRIGQDKKVMAYKFITKDTIEEKIIILQQRKQKLAFDFINNNNPFSDISGDELAELFQ